MHLILLGPPGAGKGTQAKTIADRLGLAHVATGDLFRDHQSRNTPLGQQARTFMERGALVPDSITVQMLLERIAQPDCQEGSLLDGFPRTLEQARALDQALQQRGQKVGLALFINVSPEELLRRLGGRLICRVCQAPYHQATAPPRVSGRCDRCGGELYQRDDDKSEAVQKRIQVYQQETYPLVDYYTRQEKLSEVDGEQSIEEVGRALLKAIDGPASSRAGAPKRRG